MPSDVQPGLPAARQASDSGALAAEIVRLAQHSAAVQTYLQKSLEAVGRQFGAPYAALCARQRSGEIRVEAHHGPTDPGFWRGAVQAFLTESLSVGGARAKVLGGRAADLKIALLAVPLTGDGELRGGLALALPADAAEARAHLHRLEALAGTVGGAVDLVGHATTAAAASSGAQAGALARVAGVSTPTELAFMLTNTLRTKLACEQVVMGLVQRRRVRIAAISGLDDVHPRSPGVQQIRGAMEECLDAGAPIVCQNDDAWGAERLTQGYRIHQQWHGGAGGDGVGSIPLRVGEHIVAILSLRWRASEPMRRDQFDQISKLVEPYMPALGLVQRASRGLLHHTRDVVAGAVGSLLAPGKLGRKLVATLALVGLFWFCFGTRPYEVTVSARLVPAQQRHLAAPFEAILGAAYVKPGERVQAGDVLCQFDQRSLALTYTELQAQRALYEREYLRALADDKPVEAQLAEANRRLAETQLALCAERLDRATVRAPFDGLVVAGELEHMVGSVVPQGTPLLVIAPQGAWELELDAPQGVASELASGRSGRFASAARPENPQRFTLTRVQPGAQLREGRSVFVARAALGASPTWLRPGMEGLARIELGQRRVWWVTLHGVLDYLRLHYWL